MLKLTKTGIGLLTRQYRSVLKKCWLINVGIWRTAEDIISKTRKMMAYMLSLLDSLLNIKSNAFDEQSAKATATELPFGAPTVAGTFSFSSPKSENVTGKLSEKRVFKTKLITSTVIGLMVAMVEMPKISVAWYDYSIYPNQPYEYIYDHYTKSSPRVNYLDVGTSYKSGAIHAHGAYFDLEAFGSDMVKTIGYLTYSESGRGSRTNSYAPWVYTDRNHNIIDTDGSIAENLMYLDNMIGSYWWNDPSSSSYTGPANILRSNYAVTSNLYFLDQAIGAKQIGTYITGADVYANLKSLDTQVATNTGTLATHTAFINELDNNYYRKDKKSGILNGFEVGKIGNENDDNFSKLTANDNFVAKNGGFVLNNDSFLTNNGDFASNNDNFALNNGDFSLKNPSRLGAFSKCEKACPRPSERFPASLEKNSAFEQYSRSARGTFLFVSQTHKNVLDNFSKLAANDNFAITTFLRAI